MKGTEKQVAWAEDIQKEFRSINEIEGDSLEARSVNAAVEWAIRTFDYADFWIEIKKDGHMKIRNRVSIIINGKTWQGLIRDNKEEIIAIMNEEPEGTEEPEETKEVEEVRFIDLYDAGTDMFEYDGEVYKMKEYWFIFDAVNIKTGEVKSFGVNEMVKPVFK